MIKEIKSAFSWMWKRIKKHPRLAIFSTIVLAATAYFVLPIIGITTLSVGIAVATCAVAGPVLGGFLGWVGQKIGLIKQDLIPLPNEGFKKLPDVLKRRIGANLDPNTLKNLLMTSHETKTALQPVIPEVVANAKFSKFLQHVARGEQDQAEAMLIAEAKHSAADAKEEKHPILSKLLTIRGTATDLSGRSFTGITALQYAFWAKDRHMWQMLLKYLPEGEGAEEALKQYEEHKNRGVSYEWKGKTIENEHHYNFSPLKTALQQYVDYINTYATPTFNWDEADRRWFEVGRAQYYVPAHVAHEYCREDRSFDPVPMFDEPTLPRTLRFYNWLVSNFSLWFSCEGLGISFSLTRGGRRVVAGDRDCLPLAPPRADLAAVTALDKVRTQEYDNLPKSLNAQLHPADNQPKVGNAAAVVESPRRRRPH